MKQGTSGKENQEANQVANQAGNETINHAVTKSVILGIAFIVMTFLLGGSGFFTQSCLLEGYLSDIKLNEITMQWNYLAEAIGIGLFIFCYYKFPKKAGSRISYLAALALGGVSLAGMLLIPHVAAIIAGGILFNIAFGFWFGWYYSFMVARFRSLCPVPERSKHRLRLYKSLLYHRLDYCRNSD